MKRFVPGNRRSSVAPPGFTGSAVSSATTSRPFPRHVEALREATRVHGQNVAYSHGAVVPTQAYEMAVPPAAAVRAANPERSDRAPFYGDRSAG